MKNHSTTHVSGLRRALATAAAIAVASLIIPTAASGAPSVGLVDFNANNGDFVVVSTNAPASPWAYDNARGTWSCADQAECAMAPRSSRLSSPAWTVVSSGPVTLTVAHRYSFEVDTTRWDGGQIRLSINGGPYAVVPVGSFTANGYNNTIGGAAVPTSEIAGEMAFTAESAGYFDGAFIVSVAQLGTFNAGDTLSIQFLAAWDDCSQGLVPNWEIDSVEFSPSLEDRRPPPTFVDTTLPADAAVMEGTPYTLRANVSGATSLQWFKDGVAIPGAVSGSYLIPDMSASDSGVYQLQAYNAIGLTVSRLATISLIPDRTPPVLLFAYASATDLTAFTLIVNEPVCTDEVACGSDADDTFNYGVETTDGLEALDVGLITITNGTNITLFTTAPRTPGRTYRIIADRGTGIGDRFRNIIQSGPSAQIVVSEPIVFQQDLNGYTGTHDTELRGAAATTPQFGNTFVTVDASDAGGVSQGLLRFANLFGNGAGQIPLASTIISARLTLTHSASGAAGNLVNVHRMLVPWDETTVTYNSVVAGVSANGVEARSDIDFMIDSTGLMQFGKLTFNVTTSLQAWANGEANHGWAFLPTGTDGYRWDTSEMASIDSRPRLEVLYSVPPCTAVAITRQPAAATTLNEGSAFTLSVEVTSQGCAPTFQWSRNGVDIPGATDSSYSVISASTAIHSGTYRVRVANALPSSVTSSAAVVTVIGDTVKPTVVSASGDVNLVAIDVVFSEPVSATAESTANYSLTPAAGGAALPVTIARVSPTTVRLTTAARTFGATYNLSISGVADLAGTPNTIIPVVIPITMNARRILAADAVWKFDQNNNFDSTLEVGEVPWYATDFDDSGWATGQGIFGLETPAVIAAIPLSNPVIRTPWTIGAVQLTYYLRTTITVPSAPAGSLLVLRHATDDGMVAYVNGVEKARYNMGAGQPVLHDQLAPAASPEGVVVCSGLAGVGAGSHLVAVEVHQSSTTSSDVVFGAEVIQVIPPRLQIQRNGDGSVTLTWQNGAEWQLSQATSVNGPYTAVAANPASPVTITAPSGNVFYQLQCR